MIFVSVFGLQFVQKAFFSGMEHYHPSQMILFLHHRFVAQRSSARLCMPKSLVRAPWFDLVLAVLSCMGLVMAF